MAATKEQFTAAFTEIGGTKESRFPRIARIIQHIGGTSVDAALLDIFDATAIDRDYHEHHVEITPRLVQRMFVPVSDRETAWAMLTELGVQPHDIYTDTSRNGNQWTQFTLDGDREFRAYAATRRLFDSAPEESGIVEVSAEELSLAVKGELLSENE